MTESQPVNTVITYQCDPELMLSGSMQRTCEIVEGSADGAWSGSAPSCELPNSMPSSTNTQPSPTNTQPSPTNTQPLSSSIVGSPTDSTTGSLTMDLSDSSVSSFDVPTSSSIDFVGSTSVDAITSVPINSISSTVSGTSALLTMDHSVSGEPSLSSTSLTMGPISVAISDTTDATVSPSLSPIQVPNATGRTL